MSIGSNIQKMRYQNKLTQEQVIARMNLMGLPISKSSYAKIETNRMNIRISELNALKELYQVGYQGKRVDGTGRYLSLRSGGLFQRSD